MRTEAEIGMMCLQAQPRQGLLAATRSQERHHTDSLSLTKPANPSMSDSWPRELREGTFLLFQVCGYMVEQPQETNTTQHKPEEMMENKTRSCVITVLRTSRATHELQVFYLPCCGSHGPVIMR